MQNDNNSNLTHNLNPSLNLKKRKLDDNIDQVIEPLDSDITSESEQPQLQHVYFEPKFLNDIKIIYDNTCFHTHKYALVQHSKYFFNLFETNKYEDTITIPILNVLVYAKKILAKDFHDWLDIINRNYKIQQADITNTEENPNGKYACVCLIHLNHYFDCSKLQSNIEDLYIEIAKIDPKANDILSDIYDAQEYKMNRCLKILIKIMVSNIKYFRTDTKIDINGTSGKSEYDNYSRLYNYETTQLIIEEMCNLIKP